MLFFTPLYPFMSGNSKSRLAAFWSQHHITHAHGQHTMHASMAKMKPRVGPTILQRHGLSVLPISMHTGKKNMLSQCRSAAGRGLIIKAQGRCRPLAFRAALGGLHLTRVVAGVATNCDETLATALQFSLQALQHLELQ